MKKTLALIIASAALLAAADQTFTGVVTDSMCGKDHASMKMGNDGKCTDACIKAGAKYAINDGKKTYTLSDQKVPAQFSGQKVTVTGTLEEKTGVIQVTKIVAAK